MFNIFKKKKKVSKQTDAKIEKPVRLLDEEYYRILDKQLSNDPNVRLEGSIEMCRYLGVQEDRIIKTKDDLDRIFDSSEPIVW